MTNHFYIHIPFCRQKCPYCKFALTPVFDEFKKKRYIEYLKKEIREYFKGYQTLNSDDLWKKTVSGVPIFAGEFGESVSADFREKFQTVGARASFGNLENQTENRSQNESEKIETFGTFSHKSTEIKNEDPEKTSGGPKTIYFGGGTPSILTPIEIREILECFPFYRKVKTEITLESNPEDITEKYIQSILELGINRISVGVQTLNNQSLQEIHRSDAESIVQALQNINNAIVASGKEKISVNIDFILGLPYTRSGEILNGIRRLHREFPHITHTSVYMLEDENYPKHWKNNSITENELQTEFLAIIEYFASIGWRHYELSNWALPDYESIHNQAYWDHSDSIGFGLSAASHRDNTRWNNASSFAGYYQGNRENIESLTQEQKEIENMMFGLRRDGWDISKQQLVIEANIQRLIQDGLIQIQNQRIKPTKTGIFMIDHIMSELLS